MILYDPQTRDEWLKCRCRGIGGSDAGAVLGVNKYKTNVDLWAEKTHKKPHPEIKNNSAVEYGKNAEKLIRELYKLDYPENTVEYHEYRMYANDKHNFIYATLDGEIVRPDGTKGILEIKTCTIQNPRQWKEWEMALEKGVKHASNATETMRIASCYDVAVGFAGVARHRRPDRYFGMPVADLTEGQALAFDTAYNLIETMRQKR